MSDDVTNEPLALLVRELLMVRTEGLSPPALAAFISGWTSALELVARTDLTLPGANEELRGAIARVVGCIEREQRELLSDEDDAS